jgi:hypothetical protein
VGDYVGRILNEWTQHNKWMKFPDDELEPLGIIVGRWAGAGSAGPGWCVLCVDGSLVDICENQIEIMDEAK